MPPYNGSGAASAAAGGSYPASANTLIEAGKMNTLIADIISMLSTCLLKDGQQVATSSIPFAAGISVDTIAEKTSATGVTIDGVLLKDGVVTHSSGAALLPTLATEQATTSGTSKDFTSIPSWVTKITVQFSGVSTSGTDNLLVQVGDSGGVETSGYTSSSALLTNAASPGVDSSTTGFVIKSPGASSAFRGHLLMTLEDSSDNTWVASGVISAGGTDLVVTGGSKALSATLDRVRLTTTLGSNTFDAGVANILYE